MLKLYRSTTEQIILQFTRDTCEIIFNFLIKQILTT